MVELHVRLPPYVSFHRLLACAGTGRRLCRGFGLLSVSSPRWVLMARRLWGHVCHPMSPMSPPAVPGPPRPHREGPGSGRRRLLEVGELQDEPADDVGRVLPAKRARFTHRNAVFSPKMRIWSLGGPSLSPTCVVAPGCGSGSVVPALRGRAGRWLGVAVGTRVGDKG